ncbi:E3 ubiquitin-protein ligase rnf8-B-like [Myzus persicae]|uniref:E3 ubiquitin-protein ligase rnf8-B-like n=1 Tax=Myzus persicae TaxID=13164 RepID=UPI000B9330CE|nr:E3 ubiquitin-protein ligase rnf8-B-like [Myzus persicae]
MNPICTFHMSGFCQLGIKCINKHEKPSSELDVASTSNQDNQKTPTIKPEINDVIDQTTADDKFHQLHTDLTLLRDENTELNSQLNILKKYSLSLQRRLKDETDKNSKIVEVLHEGLFQDEEYQCPVCKEVLIKPVLVGCGHMFCEWCIDKWLEKYNHCPTCRVMVLNYTHCLNMDNFIEKRMELMPNEIKLAHKNLKEDRAKEKETSIQIRINRRQLEIKTMSLNTRQPSNM